MLEKVKKEKVYILMATYNGSAYLKAQLDSIIRQTYTNWVLLIRDDCSTDNTLLTLKEYEKNESRIQIIEAKERLGCKRNFEYLIKEALKNNAAYVSFADQDDIWNENKVQLSIEEMRKRERKYGSDYPLLIYGNYERVNEKMEHISFANRENDFLRLNKKHTLFLQNPISGSTMLINNALCQYVIEIPDVVDYHDRWISLLAAVSGEFFYLNTVVEKHIIHNNNLTQSVKTTSVVSRIKRLIKNMNARNEYWKQLFEIYQQLCLRIKKYEMNYDVSLLNEYSTLLHKNGIMGIKYIISEKFFMVYKKQTLWLMYLMLVKNIKLEKAEMK